MTHARRLLVATIAGVLISQAACRKPYPPGHESVVVSAKTNDSSAVPSPNARISSTQPRIWRDNEASSLVSLGAKLLSEGVDVEVYRWKNGFPDGWVLFDEKTDRTPFDFQRKLIKSILDTYFNGDGASAASHFSGTVIIGKRKVEAEKAAGECDWYDCRIITSATCDSTKHTGTYNFGPINGRVKLARGTRGSIGGDNVIRLIQNSEIQEAKLEGPAWMELRVLPQFTELPPPVENAPKPPVASGSTKDEK